MNETGLTLLVFILAFGGMVIIHEFGHFIVARLCGIEIEEFGIGLPTPGALTYWISRGHLFLKNGKRIEIPVNFKTPVNWNELVDRQVRITADPADGRFILRSIEFSRDMEPQKVLNSPLAAEHIYVDQNGNVTQPSDQNSQADSREVVKVGKNRGEVEMTDAIAEVHPGTRFTLNWLPLGGFVRPKGENNPNIAGGLAAANPWKRLAVLVAGPLMNLILAVFIYSLIFNRAGVPDTTRVLVSSVSSDSPAAQAGFKAGDVFVSGNGQAITSYDELRVIIDANDNKPVDFVVDRRGQQVELTATPQMNKDAGRVMIGVGLGVPFKRTDSWIQTLDLGARYTYVSARTLISLPALMLRGTLAPAEGRIIGLKGIYDILQQSVSHDVQVSSNAASEPVSADPIDQPIQTLSLLASLTISLGIFNLFPFPALDGGRILFVLPELIFRRRVSPQVENFIHGLGMTVLLLFMIYVNIMDFINPVVTP